MGRFSAQVHRLVAEYKGRSEKVFLQSAQDVAEASQTRQASVKETGGAFVIGAVPVDEGDLIQSFVSGLNGTLATKGEFSYGPVIASAELGDTLSFGWTAEHAIPMEYGTQKIVGRAFMRTALQRWPEFTDKNAQALRT